jgi:thioredoxin reductase (NADPH)
MSDGVLSAAEQETQRARMFPVLSDAQIARVRAAGVERSLRDGAILFEAGDRGVGFYVILEGHLEIVAPRGEGGELEDLVVEHGPGEFTGEVTLLSAGRALVRARAKGPLRVIEVASDTLRSLIQTDSDLSQVLVRAFLLRRVGLISAKLGDMLIVGSRDSAATLHLQAFLERNGHPYRYLDVQRDPDVQGMLDKLHVDVKDIPILICRGNHYLSAPTDAQVADLLGLNELVAPGVVHDVAICGAGPGGLAAAVYGASEGLDVLMIEAMAPGGQAGSSSRIENYLGFPTGITGQELAGRAITQAEKFGARLSVARAATRLHCDETPIRIELVGGASVLARAVVIATGAEYAKLDIAELSKFEGVGVYYAASPIEQRRCSAAEVIVVGGGNSAGQAATYLAQSCLHVHIMVRGRDLASSMSRYLIRRIEETPNITLHRCTEVIGLEGEAHLERVRWRDNTTKEETTRAIRHVFSMIGARPKSQWLDGCIALDDKGFVKTGTDLTAEDLGAQRWPLERSPYLFETNQPRVFAIGDVRATSVKRVASAVGEGSVCIQLVHKALSE